jgi:hypothetical protein
MPHSPAALDALHAAARSASFWWSVMRHSIPVVGVFFFGWSSVAVAVFFVLESWLFLTNRLTIEVTFDPGYAREDLPRTAWQACYTTAKMWLLAAPVLALMLFAFGGFVLLFAFPSQDWEAFVTDGWRRASFGISFALLVVDAIVDSVRFQRRLLRRSDSERITDDRRVRRMFYRVVALLGGCVILGLAAQFGLGGPLLVLAIAVILVVFDAMPQHALGYFDGIFHGGSPDAPRAK